MAQNNIPPEEENDLIMKQEQEEPQAPEENNIQNIVANSSEEEGADGWNENTENKLGTKRRTKDAEGRNHKCSFCAKTYLSYPALYTHLKNKHAKGPDGNPIAALNVGRGRGRPKKILGIAGFQPYSVSGMYRSNTDPCSSNFFKSIDKQGGPIFPDIGFQDIYTEHYLPKEESKEKDGDSQNSENEENDETVEKKAENELNYPHQIEHQFDANGDMIKKKRGRKPKSFYQQKILEEQRQREQILIDNQIKKTENEDADTQDINELSKGAERNSEFKIHPLYQMLMNYSKELKDYIIEKRTEPKSHYFLNMDLPPDSTIKLHPKITMIPTAPQLQPDHVQLFQTQKIMANLPSFMFEKSNDGDGIVPIKVRPNSLSLFAPENPDLIDVKKDQRI